MSSPSRTFSLRGALELGTALRDGARARTAGFFSSPPVLERFPLEDLPRRLAVAASVLAWLPFGRTGLSELLGGLFAAHPAATVEQAITTALHRLSPARRHFLARRALYRAALIRLFAVRPQRALAFGEDHLPAVRGADTVLALARIQVKTGAIRRPLELLRSLADPPEAMVRPLRVEQALLDRGMGATGPASACAAAPTNDRRALYFVSQSPPHHSNGYAIRTHYLLGSLADAGWDMACFARYGYPNDRWDFRALPLVPPSARVDGLDYTFRTDRGGFRTLDPVAYHQKAVEALMEQARAFGPAILHSASNYVVGQAGTEVARRLGLPSIYEVRGLWHLSRASKQPDYQGSDHYRMSEHLEVQAARRADHVLAITAGVREILVAGGVEPERITLLPNAVDPDHFVPRPRDPELAASLGLTDEVVIGFVGSFAPYEGLEALLEAAARLRGEHGDAFRILLVGDGAVGAALRARARELGLGDRVIFTGRVDHADVLRYYSLIDVAAYPRVDQLVCQVVSPLKPLEAQSMGKAVLVSDVGGQTEMVEHDRTGLIHRADDLDSLTAELSRLVGSAELRQELGHGARQWICKHRSWSASAQTVSDVYQRLLR